jgi:ATP-binding cassette subfamily F protein uup
MGHDDKEKQAAKKKKAAAKEKPKGPRTDRLSYKDVHALETLPKEIAALEEAIARGEERLADMDFFNKDPQAYQSVADKVTADRACIALKEEAWLEVEMKKEALEADNH